MPYIDFMNKPQRGSAQVDKFMEAPNTAQALARSGITESIANDAKKGGNHILIGLTSALDSGLKTFDTVRSALQAKDALAASKEHGVGIKNALAGNDYSGAAALAAERGFNDDAVNFARLGMTEANNKADNDYRYAALEADRAYKDALLDVQRDELALKKGQNAPTITQEELNTKMNDIYNLSEKMGGSGGWYGKIAALGDRAFNTDENKSFEELKSEINSFMLPQMKNIFGNNPTEGERAALRELSGIQQDMTPEVRNRIINNAISLATRKGGLKVPMQPTTADAAGGMSF